ncbi:1409_t:CDS:2 [Racocetra fulgida]|uniref:1409_t:CDS:1 n=1 Tax=Racocetra fulgida TaxID=60492 RepID=A0A9N9FN95_9GLOM|nr:1409_t:CDS:2 [Racocetra fulgida]
MEQPSITATASQSVDYLGHTHDWSDTDIITSYKEICRQLDTCREKIRQEKPQQPKSSRPSVGLQQRSSGKPIGNISKQLQQQKHESALRAEEKRLIRMKNALWRRMGQSTIVFRFTNFVTWAEKKIWGWRANDMISIKPVNFVIVSYFWHLKLGSV